MSGDALGPGGGGARVSLMRLRCTALVVLAAVVAVDAATGTIADMEHIVIWMQENRPFDHYYGVLSGVRGFNDRAAPAQPSGASVFMQPAGGESYVLPFNLQFDKTAASCMNAPCMAFTCDLARLNGGWNDQWASSGIPDFALSYFNRTDLPWYYTLADAFTVGDNYFQSTFTATNPNRLHLFSGSNGLSVNGSGYNVMDDSEPLPGFTWETMAETLEAANVSWRVIQETDNFDDNALEWFANFRYAAPGSDLYEKGVRPVDNIVTAFEDMLRNDSLPSVLWIVGPTSTSEHATNHPADGEWLSSELIRVLSNASYASVYAKTAFIINYDEGGQFFDHVIPPTPPVSPADGQSTVTTIGEITQTWVEVVPPGAPIGLGFRVPLILVSPWTRGHLAYSEVADHTSVIRLIEARFGVRCPNISPWRRAVVGDLLSAFDFASADYTWPAAWPDTSRNVNQSKWQCDNLPAPTLPAVQAMPVQEPGTRGARPLPYEFVVSDAVAADGGVRVTVNNTGAAGAFFVVYDRVGTGAPRKHTVEAGKAIVDAWPAGAGGNYSVWLHGPNGFVRVLSGTGAGAAAGATIAYGKADGSVTVTVSLAPSAAPGACNFSLVDNAYGAGPWVRAVPAPGASASVVVPVVAIGNWYDLTATLVPSAGCGVGGGYARRFMGRMENGRPTTSDPAMADASPWPAGPHPAVPEARRTPSKWNREKACASERARMKDECWGPAEERAMLRRHSVTEL